MATITTIYALQLGSGTGATLIEGIQSSEVQPALQVFRHGGDGQVHHTFAAIAAGKPMLRFSTVDVGDLLTLVTTESAIVGKQITTGDTPLTAYFQSVIEGGTRGSTGDSFAVASGLIVPTRLTATHGAAQPAVMEAEVYMIDADGGAPYTITADDTVPTGLTAPSLLTCGAVEINSTPLGYVERIEWDFGFQVETIGADGQVFPRAVFVRMVEPRISITTRTEALQTIGVSGTDNTATITLEGVSADGMRSGTDKSLATYEGVIHVESLSGQQDDMSTCRLVIEPTHDGTNDPVVVS